MTRLLLILSLCLGSLVGYSQKTVYLKINHALGVDPFAFNQPAVNNLGQSFEVSRMEYYISGIVLHHDGTSTALPTTYLLVNAGTTTNELLGTFPITNLDSISFAIGVDTASNHDDPATYPSTHPLAPKAPSMHWGWASGYRFVAFEGTGGIGADVFQMHGLDDRNYFSQTIVTAGVNTTGNIDIVLKGDYVEALHDLNVNGGLVSHGSTGAALTTLNNFNQRVFSDASILSIQKLAPIDLSIYPNPLKLGQALTIDSKDKLDLEVQVYDLSGKLCTTAIYNNNTQTLQFSETGIYILYVLKDGQAIATQRLQVQE